MRSGPFLSRPRCLFAAVFAMGLLATTSAYSTEPTPDAPVNPATPITNPAQVAAHYREVVARPEFQDAGDAALDTSFEDWLSQWFKRLGEKMGNFKYASQMPAVESLLMSVLVLFSISVLFYVLFRLTFRRSRMDEEPSHDGAGSKTIRPPEFYDLEIKQAVAAGDWHAAWLATWRQFLSRLESRNLVEADRTRTNREYLAQLREKPLPASAMSLLNTMVDAYDRFIYGRAGIGPAEWDAFHRHIDEAALLLHLDDKRLAAQPSGDSP